MFDVWSAVRWWDEWQLRILVLGSLGFQWFLLLAAPMRKYTVPPCFRLCVWLAYISSDALAIYALATLFNRHARATTTSATSTSCGASTSKATILEVLWAPVLLIHLGGQEELTAFDIEDNELWTRHAVTLVSQVTVALYAFYKSWPSSSDRLLLASAILLFVIGVVSFSEKPWALRRARIRRLAEVSAVIQGTKNRTRWGAYLDEFFFFDSFNCFTMLCGGGKKGPADAEQGQEEEAPILTDADKVYMVLSDMSLLAAADDLVNRNRGMKVEDVLKPLSPKAEKGLQRWLRGAFGLIYTRLNVAFTRKYLAYHLVLAPALHIAALALFAASDKQAYNRTDVKITYILLSFTAALDVLAVFIRQLLYLLMSVLNYPALCEMVPGYNITSAVLRRRHRDTGWLVKCSTSAGCKEEDLDCCKGRGDNYDLYKKVSGMVLLDLVKARGLDPAGYRVFTVPLYELPVDHVDEACESSDDGVVGPVQRSHPAAGTEEIMPQPKASGGGAAGGSALTEEVQRECTAVIRKSLLLSFDRSVLVWHMATDLCHRMRAGHHHEVISEHGMRVECAVAISNYMVHLLKIRPDMLLTGSRRHLVNEAIDELERILDENKVLDERGELTSQQLREIVREWATREKAFKKKEAVAGRCADLRTAAAVLLLRNKQAGAAESSLFHVPEACRLAEELLAIRTEEMRWNVIYQVWLRMLCYSASMCRGYLHAKSLGEGGEFLSFVWLVLSLKGAKTLADKLQMLEADSRESV